MYFQSCHPGFPVQSIYPGLFTNICEGLLGNRLWIWMGHWNQLHYISHASRCGVLVFRMYSLKKLKILHYNLAKLLSKRPAILVLKRLQELTDCNSIIHEIPWKIGRESRTGTHINVGSGNIKKERKVICEVVLLSKLHHPIYLQCFHAEPPYKDIIIWSFQEFWNTSN